MNLMGSSVQDRRAGHLFETADRLVQLSQLVVVGHLVLEDHAEVGENSIIAAGAVVLSNTKIEPNSVYGGNPAKKLKNIEPAQSQEMIQKIANNYKMYASWYTE